jgi:Zinc finger, C2H2 type
MIRHVERHIDLYCDVCKSKHKTKDALRVHVRTHFENFVCEQCGRKFEDLQQFKKHEIVHNPVELDKKKLKRDSEKIVGGFPCTFCPVKFNRESTLKAHEALLHKDGKAEERFRCDVCGKGKKTFLKLWK